MSCPGSRERSHVPEGEQPCHKGTPGCESVPPTAGMCVQLCICVCRALTLGRDLPGLMCEVTLLPPSWCLKKVWLLFPDPLPPTAELWRHHGAAFLITLLCLSLRRVSLNHCQVPPSPVPASQGVPQRWRGCWGGTGDAERAASEEGQKGSSGKQGEDAGQSC